MSNYLIQQVRLDPTDLHGWDQLLIQTKKYSSQFTAEEAKEIFQLLMNQLEKSHNNMDSSRVLLNTFVKLLEIDEQLQQYVNNFDADSLSKSLNLYNYLSDEKQSVVACGIQAFRILISFDHIFILKEYFALRGNEVKPVVKKVLKTILSQRTGFDTYLKSNIVRRSVFEVVSRIASDKPTITTTTTTTTPEAAVAAATTTTPAQLQTAFSAANMATQDTAITSEQLLELFAEGLTDAYIKSMPVNFQERLLVIKVEEAKSDLQKNAINKNEAQEENKNKQTKTSKQKWPEFLYAKVIVPVSFPRNTTHTIKVPQRRHLCHLHPEKQKKQLLPEE